MGDLLFEAKGVGKTYGANTVLRDIDMQVYRQIHADEINQRC